MPALMLSVAGIVVSLQLNIPYLFLFSLYFGIFLVLALLLEGYQQYELNKAYLFIWKVLNRPPNDRRRPWTLIPAEFGWVVDETPQNPLVTLVYEKRTHRVIEFPEDIPREKITYCYAGVRQRAKDITP